MDISGELPVKTENIRIRVDDNIMNMINSFSEGGRLNKSEATRNAISFAFSCKELISGNGGAAQINGNKKTLLKELKLALDSSNSAAKQITSVISELENMPDS